MRSIGTRLALWYALASTATLTVIVIAGYYLLSAHLVRTLDSVNQKEFTALRSALKADFAYLEPESMADRMRDATDVGVSSNYVEVWERTLGVIYASDNLQGHAVPDLPGPVLNVTFDGVGELRVGRFQIGQMTVFIGSSLEEIRRVMRGYLQVSAGCVFLAAAVSCGIGLFLSRMALRPVRAIQRTAEHIGSDNLSERIPVDRVDDEISNLARLLNRTFDRLESAFNQVRRFTAEASHELKTPLALARVHAERLIADGAVAAGQEESVQNLLEELSQLEKIIEELLLLSRAEAHAVPLEIQTVDPQHFVHLFIQDARVLGEFRGVRIDDTYEGRGKAEFDPKWIRQVLLNLITNSLRASSRGSRVSLTSIVDEKGWRISIEDEGPGVPADQIERIFERFYRVESHSDDPEEKGSGLGLAISRSIVALHKGKIHAELPEKGRGLRVVVELPAGVARGARVVVDGRSTPRPSEIAI